MAMCLTSVGDVYALPSRTRRRGGARSPLICQVASMQPQVALCLTSVSSLQGLPQPRLSPASASAACARRGRHKRSEGRLAAKEALPVAQTSAAPSDAAELDLRAASVLLLLAESFNRATGRSLLPTQDFLSVPAAVEALPCAMLVIEPHAQTGSSEADLAAAPHVITYANAAARILLCPPSTSQAGSDSVQGETSVNSSGSPQGAGHEHKWLLGSSVGEVLQRPLPAGTLQTQRKQSEVLTSDCVVCAVTSPSGRVLGHAFLWDKWLYVDSGRVGRPGIEAVIPAQVPTVSDITASLEAVRTQADHVKTLKTQQGRNNQDSLVKQGVAELQALKTKAERLQALRAAWDTELSATAYPVLHGLQQSETSKT